MTESPLTVPRHDATQAEPDHSAYGEGIRVIQAALDKNVEEVRNIEGMDETTRHNLIRDIWNNAQEAERGWREKYTGHLQQESDERAQSLLYVPQNMRDAFRRCYEDLASKYELEVSLSDHPGEGMVAADEMLGKYMEQARLRGDAEAELAAFHLATEKGIAKVRDAYLARHPHKQKKWEAYNAAGRNLASFEDPKSFFRYIREYGWILRNPPEVPR